MVSVEGHPLISRHMFVILQIRGGGGTLGCPSRRVLPVASRANMSDSTHQEGTNGDSRAAVVNALRGLVERQHNGSLIDQVSRLEWSANLAMVANDIRDCEMCCYGPRDDMWRQIGEALSACTVLLSDARLCISEELIARTYHQATGLTEDTAHVDVVFECYYVLESVLKFQSPPVDAPLPEVAIVLGLGRPIETMEVEELLLVLSCLYRHRRHNPMAFTNVRFILRLYSRAAFLVSTWNDQKSQVDPHPAKKTRVFPNPVTEATMAEDVPDLSPHPHPPGGQDHSPVDVEEGGEDEETFGMGGEEYYEADRSKQNIAYPFMEGGECGYGSDSDEDDLMRRTEADPRASAVVRFGAALAWLQLSILEEQDFIETATKVPLAGLGRTSGAHVSAWARRVLGTWDTVNERIVEAFVQRSVSPDETAFTVAFGGRVAIERTTASGTTQRDTVMGLDYDSLLQSRVSTRRGNLLEVWELLLLYLFGNACGTGGEDHPSFDFHKDHVVLDSRMEYNRRRQVPDRWILAELSTGWVVVYPNIHSPIVPQGDAPKRVNSQIVPLDEALGIFYDAKYGTDDPFGMHAIPVARV